MAQKQPNPWPPEKPGVPVHHFTKPQLAAAFREWWTRFEKDPSGFDTNYPKADDPCDSSAEYLIRLLREVA